MRRILVLLAVVLTLVPAARAEAQSAMAQVRLAVPKTTTQAKQGAQVISLTSPVTLTSIEDTIGKAPTTDPTKETSRNPYVGAQAGYAFGGGDFASNLIANGSVIYQVMQGKAGKAPFYLPIRGNVSSLVAAKDKDDRAKKIQDLVSGAEGMRVAVEPYLQFYMSEYVQAAWINSVGWKLNAVKDKTDSTHYLALGRFSTGLEVVLGPSDGSKNPIVIDVSPVYSTFAGRDYRAVLNTDKSLWSGEMTLIVPLGTSTGLLTEAIVSQHAFPVWRTGLILTAGSK